MLTPEHRAWLARCRRGRWRSTTSSRSATGRRSTRMLTSSTSSTRCARSKASSRPLCLFGHTHFPVTFRAAPAVNCRRSGPAADGGGDARAQDGRQVPGESRGRSASRATATRAPPTRSSTSTQKRVELVRLAYPVEAAQAKVMEAGCLKCSRSGSRSGGRTRRLKSEVCKSGFKLQTSDFPLQTSFAAFSSLRRSSAANASRAARGPESSRSRSRRAAPPG